jgi:DNA-directed RNA polymerase subunit RPC12/RpoP
MRPFCVHCRRQMKPTKNGRVVEICYRNGEPYQMFAGDEYTCEDCGIKIVTGFSRHAMAESFQPIYERIRDGEQSRGNLLVESVNTEDICQK